MWPTITKLLEFIKCTKPLLGHPVLMESFTTRHNWTSLILIKCCTEQIMWLYDLCVETKPDLQTSDTNSDTQILLWDPIFPPCFSPNNFSCPFLPCWGYDLNSSMMRGACGILPRIAMVTAQLFDVQNRSAVSIENISQGGISMTCYHQQNGLPFFPSHSAGAELDQTPRSFHIHNTGNNQNDDSNSPIWLCKRWSVLSLCPCQISLVMMYHPKDICWSSDFFSQPSSSCLGNTLLPAFSSIIYASNS